MWALGRITEFFFRSSTERRVVSGGKRGTVGGDKADGEGPGLRDDGDARVHVVLGGGGTVSRGGSGPDWWVGAGFVRVWAAVFLPVDFR